MSSATAAPGTPQAAILNAFAAPGQPQLAISSAAAAPGGKVLIYRSKTMCAEKIRVGSGKIERSILHQKYEFCLAKTCKIGFSEITWKHGWENSQGSNGDQKCWFCFVKVMVFGGAPDPGIKTVGFA